MNLILFMVSVAGMLSLIFVGAYIWAVSSEQLDDLETPALKILKNDNAIQNLNETKGSGNEQKQIE